jgi:hypothetical protein
MQIIAQLVIVRREAAKKEGEAFARRLALHHSTHHMEKDGSSLLPILFYQIIASAH